MEIFRSLAIPIFFLSALIHFPASASANKEADFQKVMVVVFENTDYEEALKQPGFAALAKQGALLANFHAETHPSQPNYIAMVSGGTQGVRNNDRVDLGVPSLVDLLEAKGKTWKAYLEDYPGNCFLGDRSNGYERKHNPFASFTNIQKLPERCKQMVSAIELDGDRKAHRLPDFSLYIPNMKNSGHDTSVAYAGRWLTETFLPKLGNPLPPGLLLIVTFDESGSDDDDNHIYTVMYGAGIKAGTRSQTRYDHYSMLRTIENRFKLGSLNQNDVKAVEINDIWK